MRTLKFILFFVVLPAFSYAWNGTGHSTCGAITFYYLKNHHKDAVIKKIVTILESHPWYDDPAHWGAKLNGKTGDDRAVTLFMLASTFPDDARSFPDLGGGVRTKWHYVDFPFGPGGISLGSPAPETPNAEGMINTMLNSINSEDDAGMKAQDLCWIFHLIEDIHQPLHAACLFDEHHPEPDGDRGGNLTYIMLPGDSRATKLHSYWDGLVRYPQGSSIQANARALLNRYPESTLNELATHTDLHDWIYTESFGLAKKVAYNRGTIVGTADEPTDVDDAYITKARSAAERRAVLAGIRIARELSSLL